ncbi:unnamed protein product [Moneuplotes crassus]|uniref:Uncharacterized protein n=1 Tax=Euplotes crassus TaxID=5936 RepID=A0AAD1UQQ4_EUPCR|nr:unnamed protein product [Moneuplotes crassus]
MEVTKSGHSHSHTLDPLSYPSKGSASKVQEPKPHTEEEKDSSPSIVPGESKFDRAKGSVIGALCGDAIGAVLEFCRGEITEERATEALTMPGGGVFQVGPGQITDDGELAICLLHGLVEGEGKFLEAEVANYYGRWIRSRPFDCRITIRNSLLDTISKKPYSKEIKIEAACYNQRSQSNGSLMRSTPLAVFCHNMEIPETKDSVTSFFNFKDWQKHRDCVFKAVKLDATFTHPNKTVHYVEGLYIYMITLIINGVPLGEVYQTIIDDIEESADKEYKEMIQGWVGESEKPTLDSLKENMGWIKHAFVCCMRYLRLAAQKQENNEQLDSKFYEEAMVEILMGAGDTDTNACIAGGVIGAILGFDKLPEIPKDKVLNWDYSDNHEGRERPDYLVPKDKVEKLIEDLFKIAPEDSDFTE